ncbi:MAG: thioredoxin family protein [Rhodothermales bacterium]
MTLPRTIRYAAPLMLAVLWLAQPAAAQDRNALEIGAALPTADRSMQNVTGSPTSFGQAMGDRGLAVLFWSNTCPWVAKYEDRVLALAEEYQAAGIGFVVVNSNDPNAYPEEGTAAIQQHASAKGYPFAYVVDEGSDAAEAFGASRTPQVFLFNTDRRLVYEGTVDDSPSDASQVEEEYFRDAMNQLIAGTAITVQKTKAFGCTIKFY